MNHCGTRVSDVRTATGGIGIRRGQIIFGCLRDGIGFVIDPFRITFGSPVMAVVGKVPMFPLIVVELTAPATVMPESAKTA